MNLTPAALFKAIEAVAIYIGPKCTANMMHAAALSGPDVSDDLPTGADLRDYFAAQALIGVLSTCEREPGGATRSVSAADIARASYAFADAMLVERAK